MKKITFLIFFIINISITASYNFNSVKLVNPLLGWAVGDSGLILKTTNGGVTWTRQVSGLTSSLLDVSFVNENNGTVVGVNGIILGTTNGGTTWYQQTSGTTDDLYGVSFSDINSGTTVGGNGTILRTTNGGDSWALQSSGTTSEWWLSVCFNDVNNGVIVGGFGIFLKTTNGGTTWVNQVIGHYILVSVSFPDINNGTAVGYANHGNNINLGILRTTNGGITWDETGLGSISGLGNFSKVYFSDQNNGTIVGPNFLLRTTDGGINWIHQSWPSTNAFYGVSFADANTGVVVGGEGLILYTSNGGTTWLQTDSITFIGSENISNNPQKFILSQNYPNPFNPNTIISYSIPSALNLKLIVYNSLGQTIKILENGHKNAGNYSINLNASDLPSGIYFYKLDAGQFSQVKKMILLK